MTERKRLGRAPKLPPANAVQRIAALAASGHSMVGIARGLNTGINQLRRWMDEDPALEEALAQGREAERFTLHSSLYHAATKGNIVAAMFLLKSRHGYREGDQDGAANRVSITFQLPGAMSADEFKVIQHEQPKTDPLPISRKSLTRS